jgi:3-oxoacyl-(acyl-carrier-protein) synthase
MEILYRPSIAQLQSALARILQENECTLNEVDAVITGISGHKENDAVYHDAVCVLFAEKPIAGYKHIFGESYTASGLGMYVATVCLQKGEIPAHLFVKQAGMKNVKRILLYHAENKNHSFVLLSSC